MSKSNEQDTYIIPPNFIEGGTLFGGLVKIRNAIEAGVLALAVSYPIIRIGIPLTAKIIVLCLTVLPLILFGLIGINGECLSSFIFAFFKYLKSRRVVGQENEKKKKKAKIEPKTLNPTAEYIPIEKIENGIVYTKDHRYIKIIEVLPINFLLRNAREQRNIIYSFVSYLKISPVKIQFKVISKKADTKKHNDIVKKEMSRERDPNCRKLQKDYLNLQTKLVQF